VSGFVYGVPDEEFGMPHLIRRRLMTALPTLAAILILSFLLMRVAPGGPFDGERPLDPETRAALVTAYGLDKPLPAQLALYVGRIAHGDFGPSLVYRDFTVTDLVRQGLPVSLTLGALAMVLALVIGIGVGLAAAIMPDGHRDRAWMLIMTLLSAMPTFVTGPLLALIFALSLQWLPVSGLEGPSSLILPVVALALPVAGAIAKLTRAGLAEALAQDHVRTARARGLSPLRVLIVHALKPALVPVASYAGPAAAGLLTGAVVIETIFALPGLGRYFVQGALNRDYPLVLAVVTIYAALIILFNLFADLIYGWLDPRARG
jgi:oligopeptide transport system permease protein